MQDRTLGLSSLLIAAAIPMFIVLFAMAAAAGLPSTAQTDPRLAAAFFHSHAPYLAALFLDSLVMHLAVVILALGLYQRLSTVGGAWASIGVVMGVAWAMLDIAQSSITYAATITAPTADPVTIDAVAKGIQNAAHLGGGIWVLSIGFTEAPVFGRTLRAAAVVIGSVFALHVLVVPLVPAWWTLEYIGLPLFFGWIGVEFVRGARPTAVSEVVGTQQA